MSTVERGLKTAGAKATEADKKKIYRRSTIHQSEVKNKGLDYIFFTFPSF